MAWNEPGKGDKKDPWGNQGGNQQPPDLDEVLRKLHRKLSGIFGGKSRSGPPGGGAAADPSFTMGFQLIFLFIAVFYVLSGIYIVKPAEKAVVLQFGQYDTTVGPGPHWIPRFIQSKIIINVDEVSSSQHQALMLTKDQNIVSVELGVQYKIASIEDYLFNVRDPESTLEQVTDSAVRQVVGHSTLDDILTSGREQIRQAIKSEIIRILSQYQTGLEIVDVAMQPAKAPDEVKESFDDAIKAQEDEVREVNQARAYEKQRVPIAEGQAQRRILEAEAYKTNVVLQAQGDTQQFLKLLPEYERAPKVTRERLYLNTMEDVFSRSNKVLVDSSGNNNNLIYLPLDKLIGQKSAPASADVDALAHATSGTEADGVSNVSSNANVPVDLATDNRVTREYPRDNRWRSGLDTQTRDTYSR